MDQRLTPELLDELLARWKRYGLAVADLAAPGIAGTAIDEITNPIGVTLPDEARVWWGWHNGVPKERVTYARDRAFGRLSFEFLPLEEALSQYQLHREVAHRATDGAISDPYDNPDHWWPPDWFPLTSSGTGAAVALDCSGSSRALAPIHVVEWGVIEDPFEPALPSLGALVHAWISAFDDGFWNGPDANDNLELRDDPHLRWLV